EPQRQVEPVRAGRGRDGDASTARGGELMAVRRKTAREEWEEHYRGGKQPAPEPAKTISGLPIESLYTPDDLRGWSYEEKLGYPGHFPYTRGIYHSMYRGRPWTIRQFAGYGSAEET